MKLALNVQYFIGIPAEGSLSYPASPQCQVFDNIRLLRNDGCWSKQLGCHTENTQGATNMDS